MNPLSPRESKEVIVNLQNNQLVLSADSWDSKYMTEKKCRHCKKKLCQIEVNVCLKDWNMKYHKHYCCYVCFQEKHL